MFALAAWSSQTGFRITLALVSFGVAAPLSIAAIAVAVQWLATTVGITLGGNLLAAGLLTGAAVATAGGAGGFTFFATTGRKQGPVLAVEKFVEQQKGAVQP